MVKIYLLKEDKNDATSYYIDIIKDGIIKSGQDVEFIESLSQLDKNDIVVSIVPKAFWNIFKKNQYSKSIYWFQGVSPEEVDFYEFPILKKIMSKLRYAFLEWLILRKSDYNFFVSDAMHIHYKKKYRYQKDNFFVMPCFNQQIDKKHFVDTKYKDASFVYTGSLAKWQCFEPTILLFKEIQKNIPTATLTIYTKEKNKAVEVLQKHNVMAEVKYVPYQQLSKELEKFKYGFILREDNTVNNVATPTKMNTYLANGVIPIYTDVVGAYRENLSTLKYAVPLKVGNSGIDKLYQLELHSISGDEVFEDYRKVFDRYYNREYYVNLIAKNINNFLR